MTDYTTFNCAKLRTARADPETPEEDCEAIDALIAEKCGGEQNAPGDGSGGGGNGGQNPPAPPHP